MKRRKEKKVNNGKKTSKRSGKKHTNYSTSKEEQPDGPLRQEFHVELPEHPYHELNLS